MRLVITLMTKEKISSLNRNKMASERKIYPIYVMMSIAFTFSINNRFEWFEFR